MALHTLRRAANVGGRSDVVYVEQCDFVVEQVFSGAFDEAMRWCACGVIAAGYCLVFHARLCSVPCILPHRRCA